MSEDLIRIFKEHYYIPLYLLTWIISVIRYRSFFDTPLKFFPMLIIYTFFTELLGYFIKYSNEFQFFSDSRYNWHNVVIYNVYQLVFFLFFFTVYKKILSGNRIKKLIFYLTLVSTLSYLINAIALNPLHNQMTYAHIVGSIMMVYILVRYFQQLFKTGDFRTLKFNLLFWISIGLLIFYVAFPLIMISYKLKVGIQIQVYFRPILIISILLMYGFIILGLLIGKRKAFR